MRHIWCMFKLYKVARKNTDRLYKIKPLMDIIFQKTQTLYTPRETLVIDESMIAFRGRLVFRHYNPSKSHKYVIKIIFIF